MLRDADTAMYRAKFGGAQAFVVFEPTMHAAVLARIDLEADLRRAIPREQLRLDYQPIVELADGGVIGVEALIRWEHPDHGLMGPLDFIPLAEETGQIAALGRWTMAEACRQATLWQAQDGSLARLSVAVNVSPRQLQDARFVQDVAGAIGRSSLDPTSLVLEITEGAVMIDVETAIKRLLALRALGVSLAIDDFGTGHSSLALLRRLPVDIIKVDKLFVDTVCSDPTSAALLETIVRMGAILSLDVIVEGIETAEQATLIATFGSVKAQGFHLGRPMGVAHMDRLLAAGITAHRAAVEGGMRRPGDGRPRLPTPATRVAS
jgi:EAL domain-containing protein (putative c-di-GMP-specific phosphodiesterase class I)